MAEYENIEQEYVYAGRQLKTSVRFFPDINLASISDVDEDESGEITTEIVEMGMDFEGIKRFFPANQRKKKRGKRGKKKAPYNLSLLVRSIISRRARLMIQSQREKG